MLPMPRQLVQISLILIRHLRIVSFLFPSKHTPHTYTPTHITFNRFWVWVPLVWHMCPFPPSLHNTTALLHSSHIPSHHNGILYHISSNHQRYSHYPSCFLMPLWQSVYGSFLLLDKLVKSGSGLQQSCKRPELKISVFNLCQIFHTV